MHAYSHLFEATRLISLPRRFLRASFSMVPERPLAANGGTSAKERGERECGGRDGGVSLIYRSQAHTLVKMPVKRYRRDQSEVSCCLKYVIFGFNVIFWVSTTSVYIPLVVDLFLCLGELSSSTPCAYVILYAHDLVMKHARE